MFERRFTFIYNSNINFLNEIFCPFFVGKASIAVLTVIGVKIGLKISFMETKPFWYEMEGSSNKSSSVQILIAIEQIIFNLNNENLEFSVQQTMKLFDANFPYSFNLAVCMLVYSAFSSLREEFATYLSYMKSI